MSYQCSHLICDLAITISAYIQPQYPKRKNVWLKRWLLNSLYVSLEWDIAPPIKYSINRVGQPSLLELYIKKMVGLMRSLTNVDSATDGVFCYKSGNKIINNFVKPMQMKMNTLNSQVKINLANCFQVSWCTLAVVLSTLLVGPYKELSPQVSNTSKLAKNICDQWMTLSMVTYSEYFMICFN